MAGAISNDPLILFDEDFSSYAIGPFSEPYSALGEVHCPPRTINTGPWREVSTHHSYPKNSIAWRIEGADNQKKVLKQTGHNLHIRKSWKYNVKKYILRRRFPELLFFPAVILDAPLHEPRFRAEACLAMDSDIDCSGILFGMQHARKHYIFGLKQGRVQLCHRDQEDIIKLASRKIKFIASQEYTLGLIVESGNVQCFLNSQKLFEVALPVAPQGRIGLMANVPTSFLSFTLQSLSEDSLREGFPEANSADPDSKIGPQCPEMQLSFQLKLPFQPSGRSLRFGDLTGNGSFDFLICQGIPLKRGDNYNSLNCITAFDLQGNILWQRGKPHHERNTLCSDLPVQIYDIDDDGRNEIICAMDFSLLILDGATGEIKKRIDSPGSVPPLDAFNKTLGDAIHLCDLAGDGRPSSILFKDRYSKIWAFDANLNELWSFHYPQGELSHFPYCFDIDGDGCDEVLLGSALLSPQGKLLWDLHLKDHADAIAVLPGKQGKLMAAIAASDEGFLLCDLAGRMIKKLALGHMQTVVAGRFMADQPGYQIATNTYWGNPGITYILDPEGQVLHSFQPSFIGSPLIPVNWPGDGSALLLLSALPGIEGGLYDGYGKQQVAFPDDGHPVLCSDSFDINHDGRDEILCWDHDTLWIYQADKPQQRMEGNMSRRLPEQYNASNYTSRILLPTTR